MEASVKLKVILEQLKDYQRLLNDQHNLLLQSLEYFKSCQSANIKLDQLEDQFRTLDEQQNTGGSQTTFLESTLQQIERLIMDVLGKGNSLISQVGDNREGTLGIKESMLKIENRAHHLRSNCQLKSSEVINERINE